MKLLHITDIHGRTDLPEGLLQAARTSDCILISGDITHFGHYSDAEEILAKLAKCNRRILAVTGNCDYPGVLERLEDLGFDLEGKGIAVENMGFFGLGGSNPTPFNTPNEMGEDKIKDILEKGYRSIRDMPVKVLVSHPPPRGTRCDITGSGAHAGSRAVRDFIQANQVDYCLCGHIHEARSLDYVGRTRVINPGPLHMGYGVIDTDRGEATIF